MDATVQPRGSVVGADRHATVTPRLLECLPRVRAYLVDVARAGETATYGELVTELDLPYPPRGLGRLLGLLTEDCHRRGEPSLAAVVVSARTGEIAGRCIADPVAEREALVAYWAGRGTRPASAVADRQH